MGKGGATRYNSKQNSGNETVVSLQHSLLVQADMGMRNPHSLLAMYVTAEGGIPATIISTEG